MIRFTNEFDDVCAKKWENDSKIGLLCSVSPDGYPHIALICSLSVKSKRQLMWGQFSQGLSKAYLKDNPKTGFLVVSGDQVWWTGKSLHTDVVVKGEDFDYFNNKPLFRYNSYFGFGAVHYGDLVDVSVGEPISVAKVAIGGCCSSFLKGAAAKTATSANAALEIPAYGLALASNLTTLKFIAWVDTDGFPRIVPAIQGTAAGANRANRLAFAAFPYGDLLHQIPDGAQVGVYLANLQLESLLLQGRWQSLGRRGGVLVTEKVYNSMLPMPRYIYPPTPLPNVYGLAAASIG
jgi:hypothetical protein